MPIRGAEDSERDSGGRTMRRLLPVVVRRVRRFVSMSIGTTLSRRILVLNLAGLAALVSGILYLNQFRAGLIDARVESLLTQGEIIAGAISASASVDTNSITIDPERLLQMQAGGEMTAPTDSESLDFPINPERVAPLVLADRSRAASKCSSMVICTRTDLPGRSTGTTAPKAASQGDTGRSRCRLRPSARKRV